MARRPYPHLSALGAREASNRKWRDLSCGRRRGAGESVNGWRHRHWFPRSARGLAGAFAEKYPQGTPSSAARVSHALDDPPRPHLLDSSARESLGEIHRDEIDLPALESRPAPAAPSAAGTARAAHGKEDQELGKLSIGNRFLFSIPVHWVRVRNERLFSFPRFGHNTKLEFPGAEYCLLSFNWRRLSFASFRNRMWICWTGRRSLPR